MVIHGWANTDVRPGGQQPQNLGQTLLRFGSYFKPYWLMLLLIVVLVLVSTWMQVVTPES
jgi:hypothetical protein